MIQAVRSEQKNQAELAVVRQLEGASEISIEEIEARENAASDTVYCCIVNIAF